MSFVTTSARPNPDAELCTACGGRSDSQAIHLWDGERYCRPCVVAVLPELVEWADVSPVLQETLRREDVTPRKYFRRMAPFFGVAILVFPGSILVPAMVMQGQPLMGFVCLGMLGLFVVGYTGLQALLGAWVLRRDLPRTVAIAEGRVLVTAGRSIQEFELSACQWYEGNTMADKTSLFAGLRKGIMLQTPTEQLALGFTPETLARWRAFLTLASVPRNPPQGCLRILFIALIGAMLGCGAGVGLGTMLDVAGIPAALVPKWAPLLGFMGFFEGAFTGLLLISSTTEGPAAAKTRLHPLVLGLMFTMLSGVAFGLFLSPAGIVLALVNGLFGALVGWICRRKIDAREEQLELRRIQRRQRAIDRC